MNAKHPSIKFTPEFEKKESSYFSDVKRHFQRECMSSIFIDKCIKNYLSNYLVIDTVDKKQVLSVLPFLDSLSFEIKTPKKSDVFDMLLDCHKASF